MAKSKSSKKTASRKKTAAKTSKKTAKKAARKTTASGKKSVAKKTTAKKKTTKKVIKKKAVKKAAPKKSAKKKTGKKTVVKKKAVKKAGKKKTASKKAAKKAVKKKATPKKTAKKSAKKKSVAKKTPAKKAAKKTKPIPPKKAKKQAAQTSEERVHAEDSNLREQMASRKPSGFYNGVLLCEDPKPFPKETPYTKKEVDRLRKQLEEEKSRLRETIRDLDRLTLNIGEEHGNGVTPGYSIHLAEDATHNISTETALLIRRDEEEALIQVEAALERLENGIYGVCMASGDKIGMQRLRAVPEAHLCMECKKLYDKKIKERVV
ncbi:MAG: TraR/DksA family transcriptional regulator [Candidatus Sumerlaeia bacterium]